MIERDLNPINPSALDERIRIALVAPHPVQCTRLIQLVRVHHDLDIVGVAADGEEVMRLCPHIRPDVVLVDPLGGDMDSQALAGLIRSQWPWVRVLVLDGGAEPRGSVPRNGAQSAGIVAAGIQDRDMGATIRTLFAQKNGTPGWNGSGPRLRAFPDQALSHREWDVWQALKVGLSDAQIAEQLGVNEITARVHVLNVLEHLGLSSRQDVVAERPDQVRSRRAKARVPMAKTRELAARARPVFLNATSQHVMGMQKSGGKYC
jgi:DNA-binding NarL/FixJ family response regulator